MRKTYIILIITIFFTVNTYGQKLETPLKFQVSYSLNWNEKPNEYREMKSPINVIFDGESLRMVYPSGKVYWNVKVDRYIFKTRKINSKENQIIIAEYKDNDFIQYFNIELDYEDNSFVLKTQIFDDYGIAIGKISYLGF